MSGHSKWSTIKRKKGVNDAKRGKLFAKLIRSIEVAVKEGGTDPASNPSLNQAINKAKSNSVPSENIQRAIKRSDGVGGYANTGATGATYDSPALIVSSTFKRVAKSILNGLECTVDSNEIEITVLPDLVAGVASITTNQTSICLGGDPAELSVIDGTVSRTVAGPGISFLWQTSPNGLAPWTDTAVTTENYNPIAGSQVTDLYYRRAVIRRNSGGVELCRDESSSVRINLNSIQAGTITNTQSTVCIGDSQCDHHMVHQTMFHYISFLRRAQWTPTSTREMEG